MQLTEIGLRFVLEAWRFLKRKKIGSPNELKRIYCPMSQFTEGKDIITVATNDSVL